MSEEVSILSKEYIEKVDKLFEDMYFGKDKQNPPVTTRLMLVEENQNRISKNLNKALWLAATTLCGILAEIILQVIRKQSEGEMSIIYALLNNPGELAMAEYLTYQFVSAAVQSLPHPDTFGGIWYRAFYNFCSILIADYKSYKSTGNIKALPAGN